MRLVLNIPKTGIQYTIGKTESKIALFIKFFNFFPFNGIPSNKL